MRTDDGRAVENPRLDYRFIRWKMPVKRSRDETSPGHIEKPVAAVATAVCPLKVMKTDSVAEPSRPNILHVSSVVDDVGSDHTRIGQFLEQCHYCKRRIPQNSEVFMYSNLCAFCSPECRDFQISLDHSAERQPRNLKEKLSQGQGSYNVKGQ